MAKVQYLNYGGSLASPIRIDYVSNSISGLQVLVNIFLYIQTSVRAHILSLEDIQTANNSYSTKPYLEGNRNAEPRKISELGISPKGKLN